MSEKEFENVNIPPADATEKLSEKHADLVVGGDYEEPSILSPSDDNGGEGIVLVPVLVTTNVNTNTVTNILINVNTIHNINVQTVPNVNTVLSPVLVCNANFSASPDTFNK